MRWRALPLPLRGVVAFHLALAAFLALLALATFAREAHAGLAQARALLMLLAAAWAGGAALLAAHPGPRAWYGALAMVVMALLATWSSFAYGIGGLVVLAQTLALAALASPAARAWHGVAAPAPAPAPAPPSAGAPSAEPPEVRWVFRALVAGGALAIVLPLAWLAVLLAEPAPPADPHAPTLHGSGLAVLGALLASFLLVPLGLAALVAAVAVRRRWRGAHTAATVVATLGLLGCVLSFLLLLVAWAPALVLWKLSRPQVRAWLAAPRASA
ncbi:MAG TPA: hypothetical protein VFH78_02125 [Candidatus Thermoplasmatota archaeon]|nr:hypothetical protein [Candidatus Thermoplasmatota archaeon]